MRASNFSITDTLCAGILAVCVAAPASAQDFSISSERLANIEEPLATEIAGVTIEAAGVVDARLDYDLEGMFDDEDVIDPGVIGNFSVNASTQLGNRWDVGVAYFGQYENGRGVSGYTDNIAGFISGAYGTVLAGEVMNLVREETRRVRGIGNADLRFDDALGAAQNWGGGYVGQFGPSRLSALVDEDGNYDVGFVYERPSGKAGYRYAARFTDAPFVAADGITQFDSNALTGTFEYMYSRSILNVGAGYELLQAGPIDAQRWFVSGGWQRQWGAFTTSVEGHFGEIEGQAEKSGAFGLSYGFARGLSLNLGVNHSDAQVEVGGVQILDEAETSATTSVRFGF